MKIHKNSFKFIAVIIEALVSDGYPKKKHSLAFMDKMVETAKQTSDREAARQHKSTKLAFASGDPDVNHVHDKDEHGVVEAS